METTKQNGALTSFRDGDLLSPWQTGFTELTNKSAVIGDQNFDVIVVGAGITGLTAALSLQQQSKRVLVVDAYQPGFGTTGGTSAHINTFADTTYKEAESAFGESGAQLFADAVNEGHAVIKAMVNQHRIECDYVEKQGYLYAEDEEQVKQLDDIYNGAQKVGVATEYVTNVPTPVAYQKALAFPGQAQFHPLKYLQGLISAFEAAGGKILGNTLVDDVSKNGDTLVVTAGGLKFSALSVIYATHLPPKITSFSFRCAPYRSYVLGVKLKDGKYPDALVYDLQEPYHYVRSHEVDGEQLLLIGGNDHKTGHDDPEKAFEDLENYTKQCYNVEAVKYRWSAQYYVPADGFPYVGQMPEAPQGVYCATGYNGNGMMLGSIAGKILSDLIVTGDSKYKEVFSPGRIKPISGFTEFVKENADVAYHFVADRFNIEEVDSLKQLAPGEGKVVEFDNKKVAAYRDNEGKVHALSPVCTHAACIVNWNSAEHSWDCPCHGARYDIDGRVITGPATRGLAKIEPSSAAQ